MGTKQRNIIAKSASIGIVTRHEQDYICLTDMLKAKDGDFFISDWLRNRNTIEFLGIWESVYNPAFNYGEFAAIKSQAGLNSYKLSVKEWVQKTNAADLLNVALFGQTAAQWRAAQPDEKGNMREAVSLEQLVVRSNLESINSVLIQQGHDASWRLQQLNAIAITQMSSLIDAQSIKQLSNR